VSWAWTTDDKRIADMGVIGDAKAASAEFGERILGRMVEAAGGVLKKLADQQRLIRR
jgi:creatinine amidohydrolase/Fe(II)-dependent formamide hydrolase-like protein